MFTLALTGHGDSALSGPKPARPHQVERVNLRQSPPQVIDVKIPDTFLPPNRGTTPVDEPKADEQTTSDDGLVDELEAQEAGNEE